MNHTLTTWVLSSCLTMFTVGCASKGAEPVEPAPSGAASQPAADRGNALQTGSLRDALEHKTHVGTFMGQAFRAYFAPDGAVEASVGEDKLVGRWSLDGPDTFCIDWTAPPIPRGCSWIVLESDNAGNTYKAEDGSLRNTVTILPGKQL